LQNKKNWGGPIFEGRAGMIIYQLSWIGLILWLPHTSQSKSGDAYIPYRQKGCSSSFPSVKWLDVDYRTNLEDKKKEDNIINLVNLYENFCPVDFKAAHVYWNIIQKVMIRRCMQNLYDTNFDASVEMRISIIYISLFSDAQAEKNWNLKCYDCEHSKDPKKPPHKQRAGAKSVEGL
jgi:hypothetical protein